MLFPFVTLPYQKTESFVPYKYKSQIGIIAQKLSPTICNSLNQAGCSISQQTTFRSIQENFIYHSEYLSNSEIAHIHVCSPFSGSF